MSNFISKHEHEDQTSIYFEIEADEVMAIGKKMEAINEEAYMNGPNWEAFINHFLLINHFELLDGLETDSEAATYVAIYHQTKSEKAYKLLNVIKGLVNNPDKIYSFLKENGEEIEWD